MYTVYSLTPYHTHLYEEVPELVAACGINMNHIAPWNMFFVAPMNKCARHTKNNFYDNAEKAMYVETKRMPRRLFISNDRCTQIVLVTNDNKVCVGRYGFQQDEKAVYTLENYPLTLPELRHLCQELHDLVAPYI